MIPKSCSNKIHFLTTMIMIRYVLLYVLRYVVVGCGSLILDMDLETKLSSREDSVKALGWCIIRNL